MTEENEKRGRAARRKGGRVERELVHKHRGLGVESRRVPLSGGTSYAKGDIELEISGTLVGEVKSRKGGEGFVMLERWLGEHDFLMLKRNNVDPMILLPWKTWERLLMLIKKEENERTDNERLPVCSASNGEAPEQIR